MKVTQVSIIATEASKAANRPGLTPELLAASGARYSRNNEGLEAILSKIDFGNERYAIPEVIGALEYRKSGLGGAGHFESTIQGIVDGLRPANLDKGVDGIFKMIDYGHQSIADMAPVAMFMDGISIMLAYYLWSVSPVAGGQESSTRYIVMSADGLIDPDKLGIPKHEQEAWKGFMKQSFDSYQTAVDAWSVISNAQPDLTRIPESILNDPSEKAQKQVDRMKRNYVFDRARYYLPCAAATNVMMVQSARAWVSLASNLLSHPLPEYQELGELIRQELALVTPRLIKHATRSESTALVLIDEFKICQEVSYHDSGASDDPDDGTLYGAKDTPFLIVNGPFDANSTRYSDALKHRTNRYSLVGSALARTSVVFGWQAVSMAEIRDLNRHRTGTKFCPLSPKGFYAALDQIPDGQPLERDTLRNLEAFGGELSYHAKSLLDKGSPTYLYYTLLGTQYPFEHTTTADKFIYESELRTGTGAHYRYAKHLHDVLDIWYKDMPQTKGLILEGTSEPE